MKRIDRFDGQYRFLSNFFPSPIVYEGVEYSTVEHAYQAAKTHDVTWKETIRQARTPGRAKALGRKVSQRPDLLRPDWYEVNREIMTELLLLKFNEINLWVALIATQDAELIEGNTWGDKFWGQVDGEGENWLGRLLMVVRNVLRGPNHVSKQ